MNLSDLKTSKFLKRDDVGDGVLVTIRAVTTENVAKEGVEPDMKVALHFHELEKPMVLNSTNGQIIAKITGQEDNIEETWVGVKIVLYDDPNVTYGGKLVGGIRVRAPRVPKTTPKPATAAAATSPIGEENLPF